ncbi:MAG: hypothetical protein ACO3NZ_03060 [Pirellulales bacterium]
MSTASPSSEPPGGSFRPTIIGSLIVACVLMMTAAGVAVATQQALAPQTPARMVEGSFEVTYEVITLETPSTTQSGGGTIDAIRVDYFPSYVLVTRYDDTTFLWPIDRLRRFEVKRLKASDGAR